MPEGDLNCFDDKQEHRDPEIHLHREDRDPPAQ
jgi:hypothetical protein